MLPRDPDIEQQPYRHEPRFTKAKSRAWSAITWSPTQMRPAEAASPMRTKNVSMAAFALYLASLEVGRKSACFTVF